jgi:peptidoglycan/LPS O-acetylase OafA/YrhL
MMGKSPPLPGLRLDKRHFNALDLSRLLAACAVLFWHYQHFFVPPVDYHFHVNRAKVSPLYQELWWLFDYGHIAVQYFWAVSGFVFAHVYLADEGARGRFWLARVARLWPLHLLTLCLVAVMQAAYSDAHGTEFIYHHQDVKHFALSLVLAHYWGWQADQSFNGPSWSLSTEILAYAAFWLLLPGLRRLPTLLALMAAVLAFALFFLKTPDGPVLTCIGYFFGGAAFYGAALKSGLRAGVLAALAVLLTGAALWLGLKWHWSDAATLAGTFAALCAVLAIDTTDRSDRLAAARHLGDASYGVYLWHFPIQLLLVLLIDWALGSRGIAQQPAFLAFFVGASVLAGFASHRWFERPAQRLVLKLAGNRRAAGAMAT